MKTDEKNAKATQGNAAKAGETATRVQNRPSLTGKEAKEHENTKDQSTAQAQEAVAGKTPETAPGHSPAADNKPANAAEQAPAEVKDEQKAEIRYIKPAMNLEQTLKSVGDLHRLSVQRLALIARIKTLEDFEIKLIEENDELESNPYQGCKLIIKDDKGRDFTTNTPNLIRMVAQFIFDACHEKLAEIESHIVFPNA